MWICVCVFMGSMIYLIDFGAQNRKSQANLASLQDEMAQAEKDIADGKVNVSNIEGYPNDYLPKFYSFYQRNEDIKGWIKIDDTNVNFPVVQTSDNDYYHRLGFDKEYDYYGTLTSIMSAMLKHQVPISLSMDTISATMDRCSMI